MAFGSDFNMDNFDFDMERARRSLFGDAPPHSDRHPPLAIATVSVPFFSEHFQMELPVRPDKIVWKHLFANKKAGVIVMIAQWDRRDESRFDPVAIFRDDFATYPNSDRNILHFRTIIENGNPVEMRGQLYVGSCLVLGEVNHVLCWA